jgi:hypothetical protein
MLVKINDEGQVIKRSKPFDPDGLLPKHMKANPDVIVNATRFVEERIHNQNGLSIATHFNQPVWDNNKELGDLWEITKDKTLAVYLLSAIIQTVLIKSGENWKMTESGAIKREFEIAFYWR